MSGSLPDEWFRARDAQADQPGVPGGVPADPGEAAPAEGDRPSQESVPDTAPTAPAPDADAAGDTMHPAGTFGSNAAGATFSLGEVREATPVNRRATRAGRVRRGIQVGLLLSLSLAVGLLAGGWWSAQVRAAGQSVVSATASPLPTRTATPSSPASAMVPYSGRMQPLPVSDVSSTCTQPPLHAGGGAESYSPANVADANPDTAWRCYGNASGQKLFFTVPKGGSVVGFGIVNGFASTNRSGTNLYEQHRRVLQVRWTLPDGRFAVQTLTDHQEGEQIMTIPPTTVDGRVTMTILEVSAPGRGPIAETNATLLSSVDILTASQ